MNFMKHYKTIHFIIYFWKIYHKKVTWFIVFGSLLRFFVVVSSYHQSIHNTSHCPGGEIRSQAGLAPSPMTRSGPTFRRHSHIVEQRLQPSSRAQLMPYCRRWSVRIISILIPCTVPHRWDVQLVLSGGR